MALFCCVFIVSCDCYCSVALPHCAVGWSEVCDCGISGSYPFTFFIFIIYNMQPG